VGSCGHSRAGRDKAGSMSQRNGGKQQVKGKRARGGGGGGEQLRAAGWGRERGANGSGGILAAR
jgi:hypothetical protein